MKQVGGVWLPDGETHLVEWMREMNRVVDGKLSYQYHKLEAALDYVKAWRNAVDVGGHCGLWSMHLVKRFQLVHAFEPVAAHRECFMLNVEGAHLKASGAPPEQLGNERAVLHSVALGAEYGSVKIHSAAHSSGDSWVDGVGDIPMLKLDAFFLEEVDFIKLDCEGYELFALRGAEATLTRCRPCVIVEQKPGRAQKFGLKQTEAVDYLQGLGAKLRREMSGDFILSWD